MFKILLEEYNTVQEQYKSKIQEIEFERPFSNSKLHEHSSVELSEILFEERRKSYLIPKGSVQEAEYHAFVQEAVAILEFVQSAGHTFVNSIQKSKEAHDKGDSESAKMHFKNAKKARYNMNEKDLDHATPHFKLYKELQSKYDSKPNVAESNEVNELSNELLGRYKSAKLNESRREQYRIPQFSKQEADHLKFVYEGVEMADTAVAKYVADNLKTWKKGGGSIDLTVDRKNVRIQHGPMRTPSFVSLTLQSNGKWKIEMLVRFKSSHTAGDKIDDKAAVELLKSFVDHCQSVGLGESEELDELSTALLGKYKSAASKAASAADAAGDFKTGDKRFSGIKKATFKQFDNDLKKRMKKESSDIELDETQLDELSAKTLGSYVKKATVDVAQNSFNSGRKVHEPKEYQRSKQAAKSRIQGVMRAATKLTTPRNEGVEGEIALDQEE